MESICDARVDYLQYHSDHFFQNRQIWQLKVTQFKELILWFFSIQFPSNTKRGEAKDQLLTYMITMLRSFPIFLRVFFILFYVLHHFSVLLWKQRVQTEKYTPEFECNFNLTPSNNRNMLAYLTILCVTYGWRAWNCDDMLAKVARQLVCRYLS